MVIQEKKYVHALSEEFPHIDKISKHEAITRFCTIFSSWVQNKTAAYFSPLEGKIVPGIKEAFKGDESLIIMEDPFIPNYNSFKTVTTNPEFKKKFLVCLEKINAKNDVSNS
jgi:hypothetical protein